MLEEQKRNEIEELKRQSEEEQSIQQTVNQHKSGMKENTESLAPPPSERETSLEETIKDLETTTNQLKELLGDSVSTATACSMERREGVAYAFNDPLHIFAALWMNGYEYIITAI